jgi:hypothetical protein
LEVFSSAHKLDLIVLLNKTKKSVYAGARFLAVVVLDVCNLIVKKLVDA